MGAYIMNVTNDFTKQNKRSCYGKISIKRGLSIGNGDESGYDFLGSNSCYSFDELVYEEDRNEFLNAVKRLEDEGKQNLFLRVKDADGIYNWLYIKMYYNGKIVEGFRSFDIEFTNIINMQTIYLKNINNIRKYRHVLGLTGQLYFEYDIKNNILQMYKYDKTKSHVFFKRDLDEFAEEIRNRQDLTDDDKISFEKLYDYLKDGTEMFEIAVPDCVFDKEDTRKIHKMRGTTFTKENGQYIVVGIMQQTGKAQKQQAYYLTDAARDVGTGVLNKRAISEYAIEKIKQKQKICILIMDIDDFKKINDTFGHMFGDKVLLKVAEILKTVAPSRCTAGRFGGDEFFIVLENVESEEELRRIIKTMVKHIQWAYAGIVDFRISTSIGISQYPIDGDTYEELFRKADKALYIAKAKGKNRYIIYDEEKHGQYQMGVNSDRVIGANAIVSNEKKVSVISDIMVDLHTNGKSAVERSMKTIREYFDLDGVAIYSGDRLERVLSLGKYVNPIQRYDFLSDSEYLAMFNDNGVYAETNIHKLKSRCNEAYRKFTEQETSEFIHCINCDSDKYTNVVTYEIFNRSRKWSENDINFLTILGKMIGSVM